MSFYWTDGAERVTDGDWIGEDEYGDLYVPSKVDNDDRQWWTPYNRRKPRHLLIAWRSRRAKRVVMLEMGR